MRELDKFAKERVPLELQELVIYLNRNIVELNDIIKDLYIKIEKLETKVEQNGRSNKS